MAKYEFFVIEAARDSLEKTEIELQSLHMGAKTQDDLKNYVSQLGMVRAAIKELDVVLRYLNR